MTHTFVKNPHGKPFFHDFPWFFHKNLHIFEMVLTIN